MVIFLFFVPPQGGTEMSGRKTPKIYVTPVVPHILRHLYPSGGTENSPGTLKISSLSGLGIQIIGF